MTARSIARAVSQTPATGGSQAPAPSQFGADMVVNGTFADGTGWTTLGTGWSIGAGIVTKAPGVSSNLGQPIAAILPGATYRIGFQVVTRVAGTVTPRLAGGTLVAGSAVAAAGTYTQDLVALDNTDLRFLADVNLDGTMDNVTMKRKFY